MPQRVCWCMSEPRPRATVGPTCAGSVLSAKKALVGRTSRRTRAGMLRSPRLWVTWSSTGLEKGVCERRVLAVQGRRFQGHLSQRARGQGAVLGGLCARVVSRAHATQHMASRSSGEPPVSRLSLKPSSSSSLLQAVDGPLLVSCQVSANERLHVLISGPKGERARADQPLQPPGHGGISSARRQGQGGRPAISYITGR